MNCQLLAHVPSRQLIDEVAEVKSTSRNRLPHAGIFDQYWRVLLSSLPQGGCILQ